MFLYYLGFLWHNHESVNWFILNAFSLYSTRLFYTDSLSGSVKTTLSFHLRNSTSPYLAEIKKLIIYGWSEKTVRNLGSTFRGMSSFKDLSASHVTPLNLFGRSLSEMIWLLGLEFLRVCIAKEMSGCELIVLFFGLHFPVYCCVYAYVLFLLF